MNAQVLTKPRRRTEYCCGKLQLLHPLNVTPILDKGGRSERSRDLAISEWRQEVSAPWSWRNRVGFAVNIRIAAARFAARCANGGDEHRLGPAYGLFSIGEQP